MFCKEICSHKRNSLSSLLTFLQNKGSSQRNYAAVLSKKNKHYPEYTTTDNEETPQSTPWTFRLRWGVQLFVLRFLLVAQLNYSSIKLLSTVYPMTLSTETCQLPHFCSVFPFMWLVVSSLRRGTKAALPLHNYLDCIILTVGSISVIRYIQLALWLPYGRYMLQAYYF